MKKGKAIVLIILMTVAVIGGAAVLAIKHDRNAKNTFKSTGYVLEADEAARGQKVLINDGTIYEKKELTDELIFKFD